MLLLALPFLAFLLLFTVGAAAFVVGDMAERQAAQHRRGAPQPVDRPYGASARS